MRAIIGSLLILVGLVIICVRCKPVPISPIDAGPTVTVVDAGPTDQCVTYADQRAMTLAEIAASEGLSYPRISSVFEAACEPYLEDGPDAAISSGLAAARNARAFLVLDAGAN